MLRFQPDLERNLDLAWVDAPPPFNGRGDPVHERGVTPVPGLYFVGLPSRAAAERCAG